MGGSCWISGAKSSNCSAASFAVNGPDHVDESVQRIRLADKARAAGAERPHERTVIGATGQHDDLDVGCERFDVSRGGYAVTVGKLEVHQDHVGVVRRCLATRLGDGARRPDHLHIAGSGQQSSIPSTDKS